MPTPLDGKLCCNLYLNRTSKGSGLEANKDLFSSLICMNDHQQFVGADSPNDETSQNNRLIEFTMNPRKRAMKNNAKVYIKTLSPLKAFGSGSYRMTSVKQLKGTEAFRSMRPEDKKCSLEDYEVNRRMSLSENCQCVPLELRRSIQVL